MQLQSFSVLACIYIPTRIAVDWTVMMTDTLVHTLMPTLDLTYAQTHRLIWGATLTALSGVLPLHTHTHTHTHTHK